ncbi:hypothetical protein L614_000200003330 [Ochrobactrum sp. J50]|nr:hypothetical protein L614_000200003330 [Ochrobactrum sp. J50]
MKRCRRLADCLTVTTSELLTHRLDHLEAAWNLFQRLSDIFTQLRQARTTTTGANSRRSNNNALALDILWPRLTHGPLTREGTHVRCPGARCLRGDLIFTRRHRQLFELQFQLIKQACRALGTLTAQFAPELCDLQFQSCDQGITIGKHSLRIGGLRYSQIAFSLQNLAFTKQRQIGAGKIIRKVEWLWIHKVI